VALKAGIVSISFRALGVQALVDLARRAGLEGIEWGGDHAPHGDVQAASRAGELTRAAGLRVAAYGSYYRLGGAPSNPRFEDVLASAQAMGAPLVRVWAGAKGSGQTDNAEFAALAADARRAAVLAQGAGLRLGLEYQAGTLTDTQASTGRLLDSVAHPALCSFWQPPVGMGKEACLEGLTALVRAGKLGSVHVFHWWPDAASRLELFAGAERWKAYLAVAAQAEGERYCCLEFVKGDEPEQLVRDARFLNTMLGENSV
jgi:3-dehydroshikimate dehydratase